MALLDRSASWDVRNASEVLHEILAPPPPGTDEPSEGIAKDVWLGEVVAVLLAGALLVLHFGLSQLEKRIRFNRHYREILHRVYRETALLGAVALILFIIEDSHAIKDHEVVRQLEILHIAVWAMAVAYIAWTLGLLLLSGLLKQRWRRYESRRDFAVFRELKMRVHEDQIKLHLADDPLGNAPRTSAVNASRVALDILLHPLLLPRYYKNIGVVRYLEVRDRFVHRYSLPDDFPFASYLNTCKNHVFIRLLDIPLPLWAVLAFCVTLDLYLRTIWPWYRRAVTTSVLIAIISISCALLSIIVTVKMRHVYWSILHSEFAQTTLPHARAVEAAGSWDELRTIMTVASLADLQRRQRLEASLATRARTIAPATADHEPVTAVASTIIQEAGMQVEAQATSQYAQPERGGADQHTGINVEGIGAAALPPAPTRSANPGTPAAPATDPAKAAEHLRSYFWFHRPALMLRALQSILLGAAVCLALVVAVIDDVTSSLDSILTAFIPLGVAALACVLALATIVPSYVMAIHVSDLVDVKLLSEAVERYARLSRRQRAAAVRNQAQGGGTSPRSSQQRSGTWCRRIVPRKASWTKVRRYLAIATASPKLHIAITCLLLVNFFINTILSAVFITDPGRSVLYALDVAIVAMVVIELIARIVGLGPTSFFTDPNQRVWNILDVVLVSAAVTATTVGWIFGDIRTVSDPSGTETVVNTRGAPLYMAPVLALRIIRLNVHAPTGTPHDRAKHIIQEETVIEPAGGATIAAGTEVRGTLGSLATFEGGSIGSLIHPTRWVPRMRTAPQLRVAPPAPQLPPDIPPPGHARVSSTRAIPVEWQRASRSQLPAVSPGLPSAAAMPQAPMQHGAAASLAAMAAPPDATHILVPAAHPIREEVETESTPPTSRAGSVVSPEAGTVRVTLEDADVLQDILPTRAPRGHRASMASIESPDAHDDDYVSEILFGARPGPSPAEAAVQHDVGAPSGQHVSPRHVEQSAAMTTSPGHETSSETA